MPSIQERKGKDGKVSYRAIVRLKGHPPQQATFERKGDARKWATQTEAQIREGRYFKNAEARRHTCGEMIERYIKNVLPQKRQNSRHSQKPRLLWWKKRLGAYYLSDISSAMIVEARDELARTTTKSGRALSPNSVIHYMAALSHCFSVAVREWGWMDDSPMRKVSKPKQPQGRVRFLTDAERKDLLRACKESSNRALYDIVVLALSTGMRKSEIMNLTWDDVDLNRGHITLHQTKNGERRGVALVEHARELLRDRARIRRLDTPLLFPAPHRRGEKPKPVDIKTAWNTAVKKAKLEDFRFHDLRHSCASYLAMNGATLAEIAEVLGHKTLAMVKRYAHLSDAHVSSVVASMNRRIFADDEAEPKASQR